jgi:hypothetical protein
MPPYRPSYLLIFMELIVANKAFIKFLNKLAYHASSGNSSQSKAILFITCLLTCLYFTRCTSKQTWAEEVGVHLENDVSLQITIAVTFL